MVLKKKELLLDLKELAKIEKEITRLNQIWLAGLMEMQPDKTFYADEAIGKGSG